MTNLIDRFQRRKTEPQAQRMSLDDLWTHAEQLGCVSIDHESFSDSGKYRAQIAFSRDSGTRIYARGIDQDVGFALSKAIIEAIDLGAKPKQR